MPSRRHRNLVPAETVRELRRRLSLTQSEFAERLGVARRTVIRGEQRGLEIPTRIFLNKRGDVAREWYDMVTECHLPNVAAHFLPPRIPASPTNTLRLSAELIRERSRVSQLKRRRK